MNREKYIEIWNEINGIMERSYGQYDAVYQIMEILEREIDHQEEHE